MIILATMAAVIASQAVISGFLLSSSSNQLGYLPRLSIKHTSDSEEGQIYVPFLNWLLLIAIVILILIFKTSSNLASAYGLAVTLTMLCDTILVAVFIYYAWKWSLPKVMLIIPFFILESVLVAAASLKMFSGGWVPLLIGAVAVMILMTWKRGRELTFAKLEHDTLSLDLFVKSIGDNVHRAWRCSLFNWNA
jgi:KUP system potassium uptake protein